MQDFDFLMPQTLDELKIVLNETGGRIVAGGTDVIPRMRRGMFSASTLVDASRIDVLRFIEQKDGQIQIGALVTHQEIVDSALLKETAPSLVEAAATVGCIQTRNRGTLGGNIANASPAADTIPPLLTLNAEVRLVSQKGERNLLLDEFLLAPGKTALLPGEFIHSAIFPRLTGVWGTSYLKLGKRNGMAISVVNAAALIVLDSSGKIKGVRLALGSVAPTVVRCPGAESILMGQAPTSKILERASQAIKAVISPIDDVRSTAAYRTHSAVVLARRALEQAVVHAEGRSA
jgi:CO/xanthine dehydrogenase FAD-binding subunit